MQLLVGLPFPFNVLSPRDPFYVALSLYFSVSSSFITFLLFS